MSSAIFTKKWNILENLRIFFWNGTMAPSDKMPDVFHMKPLNNQGMSFKQINHTQVVIPKDSKILNNVCQCSCHALSKEQCEKSSYKMKRLHWSKFKRTKILVVFIAIMCFILGLILPLLFFRENVETKSVNGPLSRFLVPERPLIPLQHKFRNNTLEEVFISVKTTRKYHYPRLIILLETWVSLVRSQVSNQ